MPREEWLILCKKILDRPLKVAQFIANCKDGTILAIVVFSQSGGALHLDLSRGKSLLLCLSICEQFHSLKTYRTRGLEALTRMLFSDHYWFVCEE